MFSDVLLQSGSRPRKLCTRPLFVTLETCNQAFAKAARDEISEVFINRKLLPLKRLKSLFGGGPVAAANRELKTCTNGVGVGCSIGERQRLVQEIKIPLLGPERHTTDQTQVLIAGRELKNSGPYALGILVTAHQTIGLLQLGQQVQVAWIQINRLLQTFWCVIPSSFLLIK